MSADPKNVIDLAAFAASRRTDPSTSHAAEAEINASGLRGRQAEQVLRLVQAFPGGTSTEICSGDFRLYTTARRRLPELAKLNFVRRGEPRQCRISGRWLQTWWPCEAAAAAAQVEIEDSDDD